MPETIRGRAALATDGHLRIAEIEVTPPAPGEVRVAMRASGLCHTDVDFLRSGRRTILGHEGAGVVDAVGDDVRDLRPGDRVMLTWAIACRRCPTCARGAPHICETWSPVVAGDGGPGHAHLPSTRIDGEPTVRAFNLGTLSTHAVVRRAAVVPIPDHISFPAAAVTGCAVMTGVGSVRNAAGVQPGDSVVVLGCGGVGLNVIQGARLAQASRIIGVDPSADRRAMATRFGATETVAPPSDDRDLTSTANAVRRLLGGGADHAFECTAIPALGAAPLAMIRNGGRATAVSGIEQRVEIDMELFEWDKTYINPLYGMCDPERDFPWLFAAAATGDLLLDELVTRTYALDDLDRAIADLEAGRNAKGVITFA